MTSNERLALAAADEFRARHGLGRAPLKDLFELVHATIGVDVLSMAAGQSEHGLAMEDPLTGRTVVAVATTPHPMRQRSTIAHELGHLLAGDLQEQSTHPPGARSPQEIRTDTFARHLLLPLAAVESRFAGPAPLPLRALSDVVQEFEVSPHLAAIQMRQAGLIDHATCEAWSRMSARSLAVTFGWLSQYASLAVDSQQPRAPQGLMARAVAGYHQGVVAVAELASWYGQAPEQLEAELAAAAGQGGPPDRAEALTGGPTAGLAADNDEGGEGPEGDGWPDFWDDSPLVLGSLDPGSVPAAEVSAQDLAADVGPTASAS